MYTKGKWERHNAPNGEHIWCGDEHIADIDGDNANANAHLIAAAPALYEACKGILNAMEYTGWIDSIDSTVMSEIKKVTQAIAKAEGK